MIVWIVEMNEDNAGISSVHSSLEGAKIAAQLRATQYKKMPLHWEKENKDEVWWLKTDTRYDVLNISPWEVGS